MKVGTKITLGTTTYEIIKVDGTKLTLKNLTTRKEREYDQDFLDGAINSKLAWISQDPATDRMNELTGQGMSPNTAARKVQREFGSQW